MILNEIVNENQNGLSALMQDIGQHEKTKDFCKAFKKTYQNLGFIRSLETNEYFPPKPLLANLDAWTCTEAIQMLTDNVLIVDSHIRIVLTLDTFNKPIRLFSLAKEPDAESLCFWTKAEVIFEVSKTEFEREKSIWDCEWDVKTFRFFVDFASTPFHTICEVSLDESMSTGEKVDGSILCTVFTIRSGEDLLYPDVYALSTEDETEDRIFSDYMKNEALFFDLQDFASKQVISFESFQDFIYQRLCVVSEMLKRATKDNADLSAESYAFDPNEDDDY